MSSQAIAKRETDNSIPDVDELKVLSELLNMRMDYLLHDGAATDELEMRARIATHDVFRP